MRWLADECVAAGIVRLLRTNGHDVAYVAEDEAGMTDLDVFLRARRDHRILLTEDKDFGEIAFRLAFREPAPGIVLMRIRSQDLPFRAARIEFAVETFGESLHERHTVVEDRRFRLRRLNLATR